MGAKVNGPLKDTGGQMPIQGLYTEHYIKSLLNRLNRSKKKNFIMDESGLLWHRNDLESILLDFNKNKELSK